MSHADPVHPDHESSPDRADQDAALKQRHRAMWALGDYPQVAEELVGELGRRVVAAAGVGPGDRVLDVGAGSGNASLPAARTGAQVVAADLTPELLAAGEERARGDGLDLEWLVADAEDLPLPSASFDVVLSCLGVMFAPHHDRAADELARVCRPGGRLALLSWTPAGFVGRLLATVGPYVPPPPPGSTPPVRWGEADHVAALLGERFTDLHVEREMLHVDRFSTGPELREYFKTRYGPTMAAYRTLAGDPDRERALDADLDALGTAALAGSTTEASGPSMAWEYLVLTARRA